VLQAWRAYFESLCTDPKDERRLKRAWEERPALLTKLLHAIAKALNYKIEQLDILEGGYTPQGFFDDLEAQRQLRTLMAELLSGKRPLVVKPAKRQNLAMYEDIAN
jgi:hypothetical protein